MSTLNIEDTLNGEIQLIQVEIEELKQLRQQEAELKVDQRVTGQQLAKVDKALQSICEECPKLRMFIRACYHDKGPSSRLLQRVAGKEAVLELSSCGTHHNNRAVIGVTIHPDCLLTVELYMENPWGLWEKARLDQFESLHSSLTSELEMLADPFNLTRKLARALFSRV